MITKKIFGILLPDWVNEEVLKKLVYSFVGLVVAILVSSLFVWPRFSDLYKNERELVGLEKSLEVLSSSIDQVEGFKINLGEDKMTVLRVAVPTVFDPGLILSSLRQVGASAGVTLEAYEVDGGVIEAKDNLGILKKHKVNLKLVGRSDRLIRFIDLLGNSLPFSVISELSLSEISKLFNQQGVSQLEMEITYFESGLAEVELDKIVGFTDKNKQLLGEIMFYTTPQIIQDGIGVQTERQGSLFF
ncbi:hypothetical protein KJ953_03085 [Patescibacteria group bacterium]|nr:hypothetical protein [Patescibacteria group bacterium]MBU1256518.1 hypothetical protein [Patescibacteria group bacterium]MBU1457310.1 hypothetical protein [Patescibacteria group bacterium]